MEQAECKPTLQEAGKEDGKEEFWEEPGVEVLTAAAPRKRHSCLPGKWAGPVGHKDPGYKCGTAVPKALHLGPIRALSSVLLQRTKAGF